MKNTLKLTALLCALTFSYSSAQTALDTPLTVGQIVTIKKGNVNQLKQALQAKGIDLTQPINKAEFQAALEQILNDVIGDTTDADDVAFILNTVSEIAVQVAAEVDSSEGVTAAATTAADIVGSAAKNVGSAKNVPTRTLNTAVNDGVTRGVAAVATGAGLSGDEVSTLVSSVNNGQSSATIRPNAEAPEPFEPAIPPVFRPVTENEFDDTEDDNVSGDVAG